MSSEDPSTPLAGQALSSDADPQMIVKVFFKDVACRAERPSGPSTYPRYLYQGPYGLY